MTGFRLASRKMKNVGSLSAKRGHRHQGVFHRPSEPNQDFETLLLWGERPRKSLDFPVKWVMKNTSAAAALAWLAASERFSSPC
jgi:hypothetical protein